MGFEVSRATLLPVLERVCSVVEPRWRDRVYLIPDPAGHDKIYLSANSSTMDANEPFFTISGKIGEPFSLKAPDLLGLVRKYPVKAVITFTFLDETIMVHHARWETNPKTRKKEFNSYDVPHPALKTSSGRFRSTLPVYDMEGFFRLSMGDNPHQLTLAASALEIMLSGTHKFAGKEDHELHKDLLQSVSIGGPAGEPVRAIGTDIFRVSKVQPSSSPTTDGTNIYLQPKLARLVAQLSGQLAQEKDQPVQIWTDGERVRFKIGGLSLTSVLNSKPLPEAVDGLVEARGSVKRTGIDLGELTTAVEMMNSFEKNNPRAQADVTPVVLSFQGNIVEVSYVSGHGSGSTVLKTAGDPCYEIFSFKGADLLSLLQGWPEDEIYMEHPKAGEDLAVVFRSAPSLGFSRGLSELTQGVFHRPPFPPLKQRPEVVAMEGVQF